MYGPEDIRRIRKNRLGLSKSEADLVIRDESNTFHKYETGEVLISNGIHSLLKLLANDPSRLNEIMDKQTKEQHETSPV